MTGVVLIAACFGILLTGCGGENAGDIVFTEDDVAQFRDLAEDGQPLSGSGMTASGSVGPYLDLEPLPSGSGSLSGGEIVLDLSMLPQYKALRADTSTPGSQRVIKVIHTFVNVRSAPSASSPTIGSLDRGATVEGLQYANASWVKIKMQDGQEGYVSSQYVAIAVNDEGLKAEQKMLQGMYFVNFGYVNMRKEPNQKSEKIAEIPGQTILKPSSIDGEWAKVQHDGKEGYVSTGYLKPFQPNFIVRQDHYTLPVLLYRLGDPQMLTAITEHANRLKQEGMNFITLADFREILLAQEQRDISLDQNSVVIGITGVTANNVKTISDALNGLGIDATLFIETQYLGLSGITEKAILTLLANGFDVQSATHTGDDLRALTNAQAELELRQSRKLLEEYARQPVFAVAYPQGGVNERIEHIASEAGYLLGVGGTGQRSFKRVDLLRIPGIMVFPSTTVDDIVRAVKGPAQ